MNPDARNILLCLLGTPCIEAIDLQEALTVVQQEFLAVREDQHHEISIVLIKPAK